MKPQLIIPLLLLNCIACSAQSRTWTAADGRTIEAELTAKTDTAATLKRSDGRVFVVMLSSLSEADRAFVAASKAPAPRDMAAELAAHKAKFPAYSAPRSVTPDMADPYVRDCVGKYTRAAAMAKPETMRQTADFIAAQIARDVALYDEQARSLREKSSHTKAYQNAVANAHWLREKVAPWAKALAKLAD